MPQNLSIEFSLYWTQKFPLRITLQWFIYKVDYLYKVVKKVLPTLFLSFLHIWQRAVWDVENSPGVVTADEVELRECGKMSKWADWMRLKHVGCVHRDVLWATILYRACLCVQKRDTHKSSLPLFIHPLTGGALWWKFPPALCSCQMYFWF